MSTDAVATSSRHTGVNARQLGLVCRHSLQQTMRSGAGLVFVLLALFFGLSVAHLVISPFEMLASQGDEMGLTGEAVEREILDLARPAVEWALSPRESDDPETQSIAEEETQRWVDFVLDERPALLSAILFIMLFGMPLLISFGAFNQTSGDIGNRGLRYLLLRTDRANIFYGRLAATALLTIGVQVMVIVTIALYLGLKVQVYSGGAIAGWSVQGLLALSFLSLPYVAVCAWISAANDSPMVSLVLCKLVIGGVVLVAFIAGARWDFMYMVNYLLPWGIQNKLLAPDTSTVVLTALGCLAYTVIFAWLGGRKFALRDL